MVKMTTLKIPVIDVHNDNFGELWPSILLALKTSTFIAVDTELSGLGSRRSLLNQCVEERYKAICLAARTRSILSLGIACFKTLPEKGEDTYLSQTYNLTLLCMEDYTIEPQSVQFLVQHGFDFNKQYSQGIPYYKGNDREDDHHLQSVRTLFLELLQARKPLVLHNGLIDLAFLYQCFYAHLPDKMVNFIADLSEMFPAGVYDTKYASEFEARFTASYLEYAYKKCKRDNGRLMDSSSGHLDVEFCHYPAAMTAYVDYRVCSLPDPVASNSGIDTPHVCDRFSAYGWCPNGIKCPQSHNIDLIIEEDEKYKAEKKTRRRKRKKAAAVVASMDMETEPPSKQSPGVFRKASDPEQGEMGASESTLTNNVDGQMDESQDGAKSIPESVPSDLCQQPEGLEKTTQPLRESVAPLLQDSSTNNHGAVAKLPPPSTESGTHRAGFDAFMTGYIMAYVWMLKKEKGSDSSASFSLPNCLNKIYLSGKNVPLQIVKSVFSKSSRAHMQKMRLISSGDS
ncbi:target of EGR1 protein 1 isoform X1 [Dendrobates tinctorius]|uniref:target of EGR1 protein 1 isoform X1 n=2 Tax=Dendrobates tinctorius TaxID=92724 RepID=UPI003CC950A8